MKNHKKRSLDEGDVVFLSDQSYAEGSTDFHREVANVLECLPEEDYQWAVDNIVFYAQYGANASFTSIRFDSWWAGKRYVPDDYSQDSPSFHIRLVTFHESLSTQPSEVVRYVVAHEIAHAKLGHIEHHSTSCVAGSWAHRRRDHQEASDRKVDTTGRAKRVSNVRSERASDRAWSGKYDWKAGGKCRGEKASFETWPIIDNPHQNADCKPSKTHLN